MKRVSTMTPSRFTESFCFRDSCFLPSLHHKPSSLVGSNSFSRREGDYSVLIPTQKRKRYTRTCEGRDERPDSVDQNEGDLPWGGHHCVMS